jgi:predicted amidohydrolase YtcJ
MGQQYYRAVPPRATIFQAPRIHSLAGDSPEGLAVVEEQIVATGSAADLQSRYPHAEHVELDGVVVPGFNDAHMHPSIVAEDLLHLDLFGLTSNREAEERLRRAAMTTPTDEWIRGTRYDDARMAEGRCLTRADLDEVAPDHPVLVVHVAGHWGVANSKALERGGLDDTSQPPPGGDLGRDASGHLSGLLIERALFRYAYPAVAGGPTVIPPTSLEDRLGGLQRALGLFHAAGLTSLGDAMVGTEDVRLYQEAERRGLLTARINMLVTYEHFDSARRLAGQGSSKLRLNGVKAFVDGALGGRTCLIEHPAAGWQGMQTTSTESLRELVRTVHEAGSRLGVHANGDRAIALLLDQFEMAEAAHPRPDAHHRIEHCSIVTPDILRRMRQVGAIGVPFGSYVHYHGGRLVDWYGPERAERMFAVRSMLDAGVAVAGSSDYPCGPYEPLLALQSCVTRIGGDGAEVGLTQRITPLEALALYTTGAAFATGEQHIKGRLAPGHLADFVVLGEDPLQVEPARLAAIPVLATYVGGACVFSRAAGAA